ncbi:uncharacterized protein LOC122370294 [Amphibalanus amphitrite]|uniref:uncharacterized protein LOC122370294 n=1 Tax=Amphibalanus amphitrite TaxID=1232801 RepID=UPI001C91B6FA|nr:uncharacterized protein LOC122370294 [Amphibalanus amphitrite]
MRSLIILLCLGLAAAHPQPYEGSSNPENPDVDHMIALLGEGALLEESTGSSSTHSEQASVSEESYFVSTGGDTIKEITVAEAADYGLTCMPAGALTQSADIIVQESEDAAAASSASGGAAASSAAGSAAASAAASSTGAASSAAAGESASSAAAGESASSAAAAGDSASSAAAAGDSASSAAAAGDSASSAAAAGDSASSAAAAGDSASSAAAAGESASSAAAAGDSASSAAAAGDSASSAAAAGDSASSAAAAGDSASSAAAAGDSASSAAAAGDSASSAAAAGDSASSAAAAGESASSAAAAGDSASSAAAAGDSASSAAAAGDSASSAAAAGESASSAAAAGDSASSAAAAGESASSAAAAGDSASSAAAAGDSASSAAAAGDSASSAAAAGESASSASQLGYESEESEEDQYSEEVEEISGGACVPYYLCKDGDIVTDGAGLIDMRFGGDDEDSKSNSQCPNFLDVFCRVPLTEPDPDILGELTEYEYQPSCGHRNPEGVSIILDGFKEGESQFGEFPWMGILLEDELLDYDQVIQRYVCGCSLIHPQVIMTGAHCINGKDPAKLTVRLGDWDTQNDKEIFPHEHHRVVDMEIHERFNSANLRYDVGLLFLEKPVVLQQHIDTICLPAANEDFDLASCVATGFGKDQFHGGRFQNIMKQVDLPIVPHRTCQNRLRETRLGRWFRLHRTFTCAGGEAGVDTCRGDGGSPLACPSKEDPSKYVQVGIVAWGIGCGEDGVPGVYASVPKLVGWVNEKMAEHGIYTDLQVPPSPPPQHAYGALPPV